MIRQIDQDRNIILVLTPGEALSLNSIAGMALEAIDLGVVQWRERDLADLELLQTAVFQLTDEELVAVSMARRPEEPIERIRSRVERARKGSIRTGHFVP